MQSIKPLSAVTLLEPTLANFPCLRLAMHYDTWLSGTLMGDSVKGITWSTAGAIESDPVVAEGFHVSAAATFTKQGIITTTNLSTSDAALIVIGDLSDVDTVTIGATPATTAGVGLSVSPNAQAAGVQRLANQFLAFAAMGDVSNLKGMAVTRTGAAGYKYAVDAAGIVTKVTGAATGAVSGSWNAYTGSADLAINCVTPSYLTGIYLCSWAAGTMPGDADMQNALAWMAENPGYLPPWWAGRA